MHGGSAAHNIYVWADANGRGGGGRPVFEAISQWAVMGWAGSYAVVVSTDDKGIKAARIWAVTQAPQALGFEVC